jgi:C1A family cysteine protease
MTATSVDWRNRFTWNWLTNIKDQGGCGSCYIFSGIGVVEAMLRIEHAVWSCRSEGDPGDSISLYFGTHGKCEGGSPAEVLDWVIKNGVADPGCWPYVQGERTGTPTADRLGRTGKLDGYVWLSGAANMKGWLDANGPISACFSCYPEFDSACQNNSVYIYKNPNNDLPDGHCIVIVGYDDAKKAWLIRNSWGIGWGTGGYGWFGYGQGVHGLENWSSLGILGSATNPDPWTKRRKHNGVLYESGNGANHRNFEVWTPGPGGIIRHYYRDGGTLNWTLAETLPQVGIPNVAAAGYDCYGVPSATGSTYFRNFEVIYQAIPYEQVSMQYTVTPPVPNGKPICQLRH